MGRNLELLWAARMGRRDGRRGIPYDNVPVGGEYDSYGWDEKQITNFIRSVTARAGRRRARVVRRFIGAAERERGALLQASSQVIEGHRTLDRLPPLPAPPAHANPHYPVAFTEVAAERRDERLRREHQATAAALSAASQALALRLSVYEAAVRQMRTDVNEVMEWANEVVAHYRNALDRRYLANRRRATYDQVRIPHWDPPRIRSEEGEEAVLLSADLLNLLPPVIRNVVEEALGHISAPDDTRRGSE
ncbi:hypothetical protein Acor_53800 [Acrocarpospora corrugata]|uniref:Uncharacterized protein n=1 Tax=Acrocarpospora corrugata TaxID=35763 RepID=A0A5M3W3G7_9ACTN|nr:hypothetical protein [Acrocarpospora corrugata]GES03314.1 hypothetical protein Acor_53800 [Acrocarpospora corrugata]